MTFKYTYLLGFFSVFSMMFISFAVHAKTPVVVEMFGRNTCRADSETQEDILGIIKENPEVIFLNCRGYYEGEDQDQKHTNKFCNKRAKRYTKNFGYLGTKTPIMVVNGRWEANIRAIQPAVNMGHTDKVEPISLTLKDTVLEVETHNLESKGCLLYTSDAADE